MNLILNFLKYIYELYLGLPPWLFWPLTISLAVFAGFWTFTYFAWIRPAAKKAKKESVGTSIEMAGRKAYLHGLPTSNAPPVVDWPQTTEEPITKKGRVANAWRSFKKSTKESVVKCWQKIKQTTKGVRVKMKSVTAFVKTLFLWVIFLGSAVTAYFFEDAVAGILPPNVPGKECWSELILTLAIYLHMWFWSARTKQIIKFPPIVLSFYGIAFMWRFKEHLIVFLQSANFALAKWTLFNWILWTLIILCYFIFWRQKPEKDSKKKEDDKAEDDTYPWEVKDGHVAVVEILGIPLRFFALTEGQLWLPPLFSVKQRDVRRFTFQVPKHVEEDGERGVVLRAKDKQQVLTRVSVPMRIDPSNIYGAIFLTSEGAAEDGIRNAIMKVLRDEFPQFTSDQITQNLEYTPEGSDLSDSDKKPKVRDQIENAIKDKLNEDAGNWYLIVYTEELKISKATLASKKAEEAREQQQIRRDEMAAIRVMQDATDERIERFYRKMMHLGPNDPLPERPNHKVWKEAVAQVRLELKQAELKTIEWTGSAGGRVQPTYSVGDDRSPPSQGQQQQKGKKHRKGDKPKEDRTPKTQQSEDEGEEDDE